MWRRTKSVEDNWEVSRRMRQRTLPAEASLRCSLGFRRAVRTLQGDLGGRTLWRMGRQGGELPDVATDHKCVGKSEVFFGNPQSGEDSAAGFGRGEESGG